MRTTAQDERCTKLLSGEQRARVVVHDDLLTARQAHLDSVSCNGPMAVASPQAIAMVNSEHNFGVILY